nr:mannose-1-phosphate guanylyltransferase/mannose-6-phosphate isomerase [Rhizobium sp. TCK]
MITNEDFRFLVAEQARELNVSLDAVILEPVARNTAAAVATAAVYVSKHHGRDAIIHILPSDHEITMNEAYVACLQKAAGAAGEGMLVTFGINPTEAALGYGYIEVGDELDNGVHRVDRFVEKPKADVAETMLASGKYVWNSGMFIFSAAQMIDELETFAPEVLTAVRAAVEDATGDLDFTRLDADSFASSPNISIDYAVLEHTSNAAVVRAPIEWSDLGSWDAIWKLAGGDESGNVMSGNVTALDTRDSLIMSQGIHLAVQGMDGVAVIASEDAVYVGQLERSQDVGHLVKALAADKQTSHLTETHPTTLRPWGGYTSILNGDRFQVKRLFVDAGKKLSLQKHYHRAEHWVCVRGTAEVTIDDQVTVLHENQSIYIPQGSVHRLANPGKIRLEVIEVQTGSYLGEDDIIRLLDEFGRK